MSPVQSWENELAWNEGRFPRYHRNLVDTHCRPESCFLSAQDYLDDLIKLNSDLFGTFLKKFSDLNKRLNHSHESEPHMNSPAWESVWNITLHKYSYPARPSYLLSVTCDNSMILWCVMCESQIIDNPLQWPVIMGRSDPVWYDWLCPSHVKIPRSGISSLSALHQSSSCRLR